MNKITKLLCILLCALILAGCSGINKKSPSAVVATINGTELTLGEFEAQYNNVKEFYLYNEDVDLDAEENMSLNAELRAQFLHSIIEKTVLRQEIEEMGLDQFTQEEEEGILLAAEQEYENQKATYREYMGDMTDQQAEAALVQFMAQNGVTVEGIANRLKLNVMEDRHKSHVTAGIEVSEQDIRLEYEDYDYELRADMEAMPAFFPSAWNNEILLTTVPEGFSLYEWILVPLDSEKELELNQLQRDQDGKYEAKLKEYLSQIEQNAESVLARVLAGEDFKSVQREIGNGGYYDIENLPQGKGYCISEHNEEIYPQLKDAALSLTEDGQVASELVGANDGYYIVKRVRSIQPEDAASEDEAFKVLERSALEKNRQTIYDFYLLAITSNAEVTIFEDILN